MLSALMLSLLVPITGVADTPMLAFPQQDDPPVKLWLSKDHVRLGDRVRVDVRAESDGYLLVLHAEPDGRVRVLFPIDPIHDNFVRGGDEFEIRGRGDREAFRVYASEGVGTVYAAFSRDPFAFQQYVRGDHWDYGLSEVWYVAVDPEPEITDLVLRLASGAYFDYDFVQYGVGESVVAARSRTSLSLYAQPYYYDSFNVGIHVGGFYDPFWSYRPWWYAGFMGWPSSRYAWSAYWRTGWGYYDPWYWGYYDPWYYDPWYYGWGYGYGYGYGSWGYYPTYRYRSAPVVVYGDGRLRTTTQLRVRPDNGADRSRRVYAGTLGSSVRRASVASSVSPTTRRLAPSNGTESLAPRRATASAARRTVDSPGAAPAARNATAPTSRRVSTTPRTLSATERQPQSGAVRETTPTRRASPSRVTTSTRSVTPTRQTTTRRTPVTTQSATPRRATTSSRPTTSGGTPMTTGRPTATRSAPVRSSGSSAPRSAPVRSSRPATSRSVPMTTSRPATVRSAPVRSSGSSVPRTAPVRSSGSSGVRSAPARTSGSGARPSSSSGSRRPASTSSGRRKP